ncbi:MAG: hypothetical protein JJ902_04210 [Roseibium sp.]|nr:hypothetical protein [Roseibium sp.]
MNDNDHLKVRLFGERVWAKRLTTEDRKWLVEIVNEPVGFLHSYQRGSKLWVQPADDGLWIPC